MAPAEEAGLALAASTFEFPAATTQGIPWAVRASTALFTVVE
jgi:hypothetical protein